MGLAALNLGSTGCQSALLPAPAEGTIDDFQDPKAQHFGGGAGNDASCEAPLAQMEPLVGVRPSSARSEA